VWGADLMLVMIYFVACGARLTIPGIPHFFSTSPSLHVLFMLLVFACGV